MGLLFFFKFWEFVCLHRSLSTLSQSHKFRSRCPESQSESGDFKGLELESESHKKWGLHIAAHHWTLICCCCTLSNRLRMVFSQIWANIVRLPSRKSISGWSTASDSCWMMLRWAGCDSDTCPVPDTFASKLPTCRILSFIWLSKLFTQHKHGCSVQTHMNNSHTHYQRTCCHWLSLQ